REEDRVALVAAATSGDKRFFAGTDSAPHLVHLKEMDCGCAGVFNAPTALSVYAQLFEEAGALHNLEGFLSLHGAAFYGEPPGEERITLAKEAWVPPERIEVEGRDGGEGRSAIRVFLGGTELSWKVISPGNQGATPA